MENNKQNFKQDWQSTTLSVDELNVDTSYQRDLRKTAVKITLNYDINKVNHLIVNQRADGSYWIINGQHTWVGAKGAGEKRLPVKLFKNLTQAQEAIMFAEQNDNTTKLVPADTFKAHISTGDENLVDVKINNLIKEYGMSVTKIFTNIGYRAISKLRKHYRIHGEDGLRYIFQVMVESGWRDWVKAYGEKVQEAIANMYVKKKPIQRVIWALKGCNPDKYTEKVFRETGSDRVQCYVQIMENMVR